MNEKDIEYYYNKILKMVEKIVGKTTTNSIQLDNVGKILFNNEWGGIFSSDTIPLKSKMKKYSITNNKPREHFGEHWISLLKDGKNIIIYDSFGRETKNLLPSYFKKNKNCIVDTDYDKEQNLLETNCGARCIAFLLFCKYFGVENGLKL
jgi:hypothetical protein